MTKQHAAITLALALFLLRSSAFAAEPLEKPDAPAFDPKDRTTWSKAVAHFKADRLKLSKALAVIALDEKRKAVDRDLAVQLWIGAIILQRAECWVPLKTSGMPTVT